MRLGESQAGFMTGLSSTHELHTFQHSFTRAPGEQTCCIISHESFFALASFQHREPLLLIVVHIVVRKRNPPIPVVECCVEIRHVIRLEVPYVT